ncbi:MAG: response regulator transcription factor [Deltaproteobacteria bacterium]|nr:response regulator transcription factor [Deltaproteobacteria bacterium]
MLLVEDDANLRTTLDEVLRDEGLSVATADSVASASALLAAASFDLVILDLMLPDGDGYSLCERIRREGKKARVLMLTARTLDGDLERGFEVGADDYLKKPYRLRELLARVKALLRRADAAVPAPQGLLLGELRIDKDARRVVDAAGAEIPLTRTELDLLVLFIEQAGKALSRNEILDRVWGKSVVVDERTVDNFVSSLKKKLRWTPESPFNFRSVRGVGYRLERS